MSRKRRLFELSESEDSRKGDFSADDDDCDYHPTGDEEGSNEDSVSEIEEDSRCQRRCGARLFNLPLESENSNILSVENGEPGTLPQSEERGDSESSDEIFSIRRPLMIPNRRPKHRILEDSSSAEEEEGQVKPGPSSNREGCPIQPVRRVSVSSVLSQEGHASQQVSPVHDISKPPSPVIVVDLNSRPPSPQHEDNWVDVDSNDEETPPDFPFTADPGFKVQSAGCSNVSQLIDLYFTDDFINLLVAQTNLYANQCLNSRRIGRNSRLKAWKDTTSTEMRVFLGLLLHMGTVNLPSLEHYWKKDDLYYMPLFSAIMSRNRFQLILRHLHFTNNEEDDGTPLYKLQSVLDHFNKVMSEIYTPKINICIDESMMLWRGRLVFRQYIKNKKHKYGIKLYKLCESNGIVLKIRIYTGKNNEAILRNSRVEYNHSTQIVMDLLQGYLDKGYKLYTDNFYNSVLLTKLLTDRSTYVCGTLRKNRKGNPKTLLSTKLKKGQMITKRTNNVFVCNWKDKREVLCISNMHKPILVPVSNKNGRVSMKPNVVRDYNNGMSGIDLSDQMLSYYSALRKTLFWYKKLAIHIFEIFIHNACMIYNQQANLPPENKIDALSFKDEVVKYLLGEKFTKHRLQEQKKQVQLHYLERLPPTQKKQKPTKPCRVCTKEKKRKETVYYCPVCPEKPALCVENCFKIFHSFVTSQ